MNIEGNVGRAIIRFVEKQMPQIINILASISENVTDMASPKPLLQRVASAVDETKSESSKKKRFMLTIDEEELRNIKMFIFQLSDNQVIPDNFSETIKELFYVDGGRQHGIMDKRADVDVEEVT